MADTDPVFTPRLLRDGSGWYVIVDWLNGDRLHVNGFIDEAEAQEWASADRHVWLSEVRVLKRD